MNILSLFIVLQSLLPRAAQIPAGSFVMGSPAPAAIEKEEDWFEIDECPQKEVSIPYSFYIGITEVTNAQYEQYDPAHKALRGKQGFSSGDDEAVVFVSWHDAMGYCRWLSGITGQTWRLPTEAEWEYSCRAGTTTPFSYGDTLPEGLLKLNYSGFHNDHIFRPVPLRVAQGAAPNAFGLYDMHGNVEEWCLDWYDDKEYYKVTRGGSHSTEPRFLRSAARSAAIPEDCSYLIGFRVVCAPYPDETGTPEALSVPGAGKNDSPGTNKGLSVPGKKQNEPARRIKRAKWKKVKGPVFETPIPYILPAPEGVVMYHHNHEPAVTWCPNGDLLAIWFSCRSENDREMTVLCSRFPKGGKQWTAPQPFFDVPDRNMTGCSLIQNEATGEIIHLGGVEASGWWRNLAIAMRRSSDNGRTWTRPVLVNKEHDLGNQLVAGMIKTREGVLVQVCDAHPGGVAGSVVHISRDSGYSWERRGDPSNLTFTEGGSGPDIAGIHAGVVELADGRLMAFGRGVKLKDESGVMRMPVSYSSDLGNTWTWKASPFPPIGTGQRLVLMRLREGPIMLVSFAPESGMFASLSYDEGESWTEPKTLTDGRVMQLEGGAWTGSFTLDASHSEPKGYLAATQTPDGIIHLLSSLNHYRFNIEWLQE